MTTTRCWPPLSSGTAAFFLNQDRIAEAEPYFRRGFQIRERLLGPDHPDVAISASYLGYVSRVEGRLDEAEARLEQALRIFERTLGPNHFNVGANLLYLAPVYHQTGRLDKAEAAYQRSLAIWQDMELGDSSNATSAQTGLADVVAARRQWSRAESMYTETERAWRQCFGVDSPVEVSASIGAAEAVLRLERYEEAARLIEQAMERAAALRAQAPESTKIAMIQVAAEILQADLQAAQNNQEKARQLRQQALSTLNSLADADNNLPLVAARAELLLLLARAQAAQPLVRRLQAAGWVDLDLNQLCELHGFAVDQPKTAVDLIH